MSNDCKDFSLGLFWGILIGAALGVLYAPRKGDETRQILTERAHNVGDKVNEALQAVREKADEVRKEGERLLKPTSEA